MSRRSPVGGEGSGAEPAPPAYPSIFDAVYSPEVCQQTAFGCFMPSRTRATIRCRDGDRLRESTETALPVRGIALMDLSHLAGRDRRHSVSFLGGVPTRRASSSKNRYYGTWSNSQPAAGAGTPGAYVGAQPSSAFSAARGRFFDR